MRLQSVFAVFAGLALAASATAQQRQYLPTSREKVPQPAAEAVQAAPVADAENLWLLDLSNGGRVAIQLRADAAPNHVERIKTLTRQGFYNGLAFHRVIDGFMAQGGDPDGDGTGGSTLPDLTAEFNRLPHVRGAVAAARAESENSANSQFYIMFAPRFSLDGKYTVFGRVVEGMGHVDGIERGEPPLAPTRIVRASIAADGVPPPTPAEIAAANASRAPATAVPGLTLTPAPAPGAAPAAEAEAAPEPTAPQR